MQMNEFSIPLVSDDSITLAELLQNYGISLTEDDLLDTHEKYGSIHTRYIGIRYARHSMKQYYRLLVQRQEANAYEKVYFIIKG